MENFLLLCDALVGTNYEIESMCDNIDIKTKTRLFELGFFSGEKLKVIKKSLNGGVLLVEIRNTILSIRKKEASCVVIK